MERDPGVARNLVVLADQGDREAWAATRRDGLGGSDVAAICGEHPHRRPVDVWNDKLHAIEGLDRTGDEDIVDRLEMGHVLEPVILEMLADGRWRPAGTGRRLIWRPPLVARRDRPWQRGSCDGLSIPMPGEWPRRGYVIECGAFPELAPPGGGWWERIDECKTHGYFAGAAYDDPHAEEPVPPDKWIQTAWYAELWEVPTVALPALIDTHLRRFWTWTHSKEFGADLLTIAEEWWKRHIVDGLMPDPDGTERYRRHLRRRFAKDNGATVKAGPELDAVVAEYMKARELKKETETNAERLAQVIQAAMGDAAYLETHMGRFSWTVGAGRVKLRAAVDAAYKALGWTPLQCLTHEDEHRGDPIRTFRSPQKRGKK